MRGTSDPGNTVPHVSHTPQVSNAQSQASVPRDTVLDSAQEERILQMALKQGRIGAVKELRAVTGMGLRDAIETVEALLERHT